MLTIPRVGGCCCCCWATAPGTIPNATNRTTIPHRANRIMLTSVAAIMDPMRSPRHRRARQDATSAEQSDHARQRDDDLCAASLRALAADPAAVRFDHLLGD